MQYIREIVIGLLLILACFLGFIAFQNRGISEHALQEITRLKQDNEAKERAFKASEDSVKHFKIMADTWFKEAMKKQAVKTVIITRFNDAKAKIDSLPNDSLQLVFDRRYRANRFN